MENLKEEIKKNEFDQVDKLLGKILLFAITMEALLLITSITNKHSLLEIVNQFLILIAFIVGYILITMGYKRIGRLFVLCSIFIYINVEPYFYMSNTSLLHGRIVIISAGTLIVILIATLLLDNKFIIISTVLSILNITMLRFLTHDPMLRVDYISIVAILAFGCYITISYVNQKKFLLETVIHVAEERSEIEEKLVENNYAISLIESNYNYINGILASLHDSLIVTDANKIITMVNHSTCDLLGYSEEELIGQSFMRICDCNLNDIYTTRIVVDKLFLTSSENHYIKKGGSSVPVLISCSSINDSDNRPSVYIYSAIDISMQKETEALVLQAKKDSDEANQAKSNFIANMSHELRTPMNGIIGLTDMLINFDNENLNQEQRDWLNLIKTSSHRLLGLLNDILDLSKIESGNIAIENTKFDIDQLIEETEDLFFSLTRKNSTDLYPHALKFIVVNNLIDYQFLVTDLGKLRHILTNLIGNAVKFTPQGSITLELSLQGNMIELSITDTGIGISEDELGHVFERFRQVDNSISKQYQGSGLGLSLCQEFVELLGGEISIQSNIGIGTSVRFTLPHILEKG